MASKGVNKVILVGNLGKDPEIRYMPSGGAVANITLATSESWRDKTTGEQKEKTEWHNVSIFGKLAEIAGEYLRKGSQIYIEGALQTRKWQDQSGNDRYTTEVVVQGFNGTMQMLGGRQGGGQPSGGLIKADKAANHKVASNSKHPLLLSKVDLIKHLLKALSISTATRWFPATSTSCCPTTARWFQSSTCGSTRWLPTTSPCSTATTS